MFKKEGNSYKGKGEGLVLKSGKNILKHFS